MKIERDAFKLKRLISEMLINEIKNTKSKNRKTKSKVENSETFTKSNAFKVFTEYVIKT